MDIVSVALYEPISLYVKLEGLLGNATKGPVPRSSVEAENPVLVDHTQVTNVGAMPDIGVTLKLKSEQLGVTKLQELLQESSAIPFASSHCSPLLTTPFPHRVSEALHIALLQPLSHKQFQLHV